MATTAQRGSPVSLSAYEIKAYGAIARNYSIDYVAGGLRVTPAPLLIAAGTSPKFMVMMFHR